MNNICIYINVVNLFAVRVLQAAIGMQLREPGDDERAGPRLHAVEQRPLPALLRLRLLPGRRPRGHPPRLAQARRPQHRRPRVPHRHLLHRLLRFPEHEEGRDRLPLRRKSDDQDPTQMGFLLVNHVIYSLISLHITFIK